MTSGNKSLFKDCGKRYLDMTEEKVIIIRGRINTSSYITSKKNYRAQGRYVYLILNIASTMFTVQKVNDFPLYIT